MAPLTRGIRARAAASADRIPLDALFMVLLLLPAKDLCRLHAVCRSWRSLISDKVFIAAHAACHRDHPLFVAKFWDDKTSGVVYIIDLAGTILKRIDSVISCGPLHQLLITRSAELACLVRNWDWELASSIRCRVLHLATGAARLLPNNPAVEHQADGGVRLDKLGAYFTLGRVSSTGEHKVLRLLNRHFYAQWGFGHPQFFDVFTINGGGGTDNNQARCRGQANPSYYVEQCSSTAVDGMVYYLTSWIYDVVRDNVRIPADYIVSFDLGREEWRRDLQGPTSSNNAGSMEASRVHRRQLALAELKGSLVVADHRRHPFDMDIWLLVDFGRGLWVKEYHIQTASINRNYGYKYHLKPLLVLDDGRLVAYEAPTGRLLVWEPGTNTFQSVAMRSLHSIAVYTGNILSLGRGCERV